MVRITKITIKSTVNLLSHFLLLHTNSHSLDFPFFVALGIDPSKWESVFESFEQADPSTTRL